MIRVEFVREAEMPSAPTVAVLHMVILQCKLPRGPLTSGDMIIANSLVIRIYHFQI